MDKCVECGSNNVEQKREQSCSCHINPPCSACTDAPIVCGDCGHIEEYKPEPTTNYKYTPQVYKSPMERLAEMDGKTFDYVSMPHTHFTMVMQGRYPEGMTRVEVESKVIGTFGGRFERFDSGYFKYISYTD